MLVDGYLAYAEYRVNRSKPEDQALGKIALALSQHMEFDEFDELRTFEADLPGRRPGPGGAGLARVVD